MATRLERARWLAGDIRRHAGTIREKGLASVVGKDAARARRVFRKWRWRLTHRVAPRAVPVFVVGLQRSGTNMLVEGLNESPEVAVFNENDRRAFHRFELRPEEDIRGLVERTNHRCVVFKALCDSHRVAHLLDDLGAPSSGRAIWIYRSMEARARSAVALFGDDNLQVLRKIAKGRAGGLWQAEALTEEHLRLIRGFDLKRMTPESAAALFWYIRNSLYFELELDRREDIMLTSYEQLLMEPEGVMRSLCSFLGLEYSKPMTAHIAFRPPPTSTPLEIDPKIRALCAELEQRLDDALECARFHENGHSRARALAAEKRAAAI